MMDAGAGGVRSQGVNPDCPNAANPFHRCAAYCPVPAPVPAPNKAAAAAAVRSKPSPPRPRATTAAVQNGTAKHGDGAARVAPASDADEDEEDGGEKEESRAVNPGYPASPPRPGPGPVHAAQNGTVRRDEVKEEECEITVVDDSEEHGESVEDHGGREHEEEVSGGGRTRASARSPATERGEAGGERQRRAVNPDCPNAANPFHRCAEYCPVPAPKAPPRPRGYEGSTHSDPGELHPRPRRRDKGGGSGGLPLYVFLREGSDGDGKKVDPRCPNAPNPFHVCTDHCLAKIAEAGRSSEGAKSPISLFSRHSRRSSSSSEDGSVKSKKVDPSCPNAGNPFHECGEHCAAKMQQSEQQHKGVNIKSPRRKGGKNATAIPNWKVDPRCPNASNPFHMCAQYCFDHLSETAQPSAAKSDKRRGKGVSRDEERGETKTNPDCANASSPYHECGDHCRRKGGGDR